MKFKKTGAEKSTITREINDLTEKTGNIYKAVSILANRSKQINEKMKEELLTKLEEFALDQEQLDEVFENIANNSSFGKPSWRASNMAMRKYAIGYYLEFNPDAI